MEKDSWSAMFGNYARYCRVLKIWVYVLKNLKIENSENFGLIKIYMLSKCAECVENLGTLLDSGKMLGINFASLKSELLKYA